MKRTLLIALSLALKAALNFAAVVLYSHLMSPAEYGVYAFVLTLVLVSDALLFLWLRYSFVRFHTRPDKHEAFHYLGHIIVMYLAMSAAAVLVAVGGATVGHLANLTPLYWLLGGALVVGEGAYNVIALYANTRKREDIFLALNVAKPLLALGLGWWLINQGHGITGALFGQLIAYLAVNIAAVAVDSAWRHLRFKPLRKAMFLELARFGLPLVVVAGMEYAMVAGNRTFVISYLGAEAAGVYAVANDLVQKLLVFLMMTVHTSMSPIVVSLLEHEGIPAARNKLRENAVILAGLAIPAAVGMALLSPQLTHVFLGESFHAGVAPLITLFTLMVLPKCAMSFYVAQAFYLSKTTQKLFWPSIATLALSLLLGWWLTPLWGVVGALSAMAISWLFYLAVAVYLARHSFRLPLPVKDIAKIFIATLLMSAVVWPLSQLDSGLLGLLISSAAGGTIYLVGILLLGVEGTQASLKTIKKVLHV